MKEHIEEIQYGREAGKTKGSDQMLLVFLAEIEWGQFLEEKLENLCFVVEKLLSEVAKRLFFEKLLFD